MIKIVDRHTPAACLISAMAITIAAAPAWSQADAGAAWPCVQRKVATISPGAVWNGPSLAAAADWTNDFDAAALAQKLASRRTSIDEVDALVDAFARKSGEDRAQRLTRVFAGVLDLVNTERSRVITGIERY